MSGILPVSMQGPAALQRSELPAALMATRPPALAMAVETARAPLPADAAQRPADVRFTDRQGRPVGPPPSFKVSLLEAQREAMMHPASGQIAIMGPADAGFALMADEAAADLIDRRL